jgi:hypothetical protein
VLNAELLRREPLVLEEVFDSIPSALTGSTLNLGITLASDTYQILSSDSTVVCSRATPFTVTLPTAVEGQFFFIKNIGAGTVTLEGSGSDTIDGDPNQTLYQWDGVLVQCSAANVWVVL